MRSPSAGWLNNYGRLSIFIPNSRRPWSALPLGSPASMMRTSSIRRFRHCGDRTLFALMPSTALQNQGRRRTLAVRQHALTLTVRKQVGLDLPHLGTSALPR